MAKKTAKKTKTPTKKAAKTKPASTKRATRKKSPAKTTTTKTESVDDPDMTDERRGGDERRDDSPVTSDRRKVQRRRQIDPTTCERDYTNDEIEFMKAMDVYKRKNGRMFPTCSEILEVVRAMGYQRVGAATDESPATNPAATSDESVAVATVESEFSS